jgi:hypothetical protein
MIWPVRMPGLRLDSDENGIGFDGDLLYLESVSAAHITPGFILARITMTFPMITKIRMLALVCIYRAEACLVCVRTRIPTHNDSSSGMRYSVSSLFGVADRKS